MSDDQPDIVAELNRWLAESVNEIYGPTPVMVRCARAEIVALRTKVAEERERLLACAQYDALMEGPKFKSWNRSALDRLRVEYEESRHER